MVLGTVRGTDMPTYRGDAQREQGDTSFTVCAKYDDRSYLVALYQGDPGVTFVQDPQLLVINPDVPTLCLLESRYLDALAFVKSPGMWFTVSLDHRTVLEEVILNERLPSKKTNILYDELEEVEDAILDSDYGKLAYWDLPLSGVMHMEFEDRELQEGIEEEISATLYKRTRDMIHSIYGEIVKLEPLQFWDMPRGEEDQIVPTKYVSYSVGQWWELDHTFPSLKDESN